MKITDNLGEFQNFLDSDNKAGDQLWGTRESEQKVASGKVYAGHNLSEVLNEIDIIWKNSFQVDVTGVLTVDENKI